MTAFILDMSIQFARALKKIVLYQIIHLRTDTGFFPNPGTEWCCDSARVHASRLVCLSVVTCNYTQDTMHKLLREGLLPHETGV